MTNDVTLQVATANGSGSQPPRIGPARLVGIAASAGGAERVASWLERAAAAGADVALISAGPVADTAVRRRSPTGRGPGAMVRALDAEDQVRPIDALVLAGRRERLLLTLAPRSLRGAVPPLDPSAPVDSAVRSVHERTRTPVAT